MRNMSFALTTQQILNRTKTVTRRVGWDFLKPGTLLQAVEKGQGLKKGERINRLRVIRVKDVRVEPLDAIRPEDVAKEGFHGMTPTEFVDMFCKANRVYPRFRVNRIEFEYVD